MAQYPYYRGAFGGWAGGPAGASGQPRTSTVTQYDLTTPPARPEPGPLPTNGAGNTTSTPDSDPDYYNKLRAQTGLGQPLYIDDATRRNLLAQQGGLAGQFADQAQAGYNAYGAQGQQALSGLQAIANGQNSVSALQLQQAMQANLAQQRSLAAGAGPQNAGMAARTAALQMGRANAGLAGQQALAGMQERNQAWQQYGGLLQGLRGQDLNAAIQSRATANNSYGAAPFAPQGNNDAATLTALAAGIGAYAASDRRLKTDVKDGDAAASKASSKLPAFAFAYKDARFGKGKQLGVMAQDLERAGLGHTVVDTPGGKVVHGTKLATANTAMIAAMGRRLAELERKKAG